MTLSRIVTTLAALTLFTAGSLALNPGAAQPPRSAHGDEYGMEDEGFDRSQAEIERMITPEYRRLGMGVERLPNGDLRLRLPGEVLFAYDSANINPAFTPILRQITDIMVRRPRVLARIIGYTDNVGSESYNLDLSLRRAESVAAFLGGQGVNARRLFTEGRGERDPVASNATPEGRQLNRRVDIILRKMRGDRPQRPQP